MLVLGTSNQLTNIQDGFKSLNGYPFVANSGVYKCEIVRATLEDVFTSDKEREVNGGQERKKAIHLGLLATYHRQLQAIRRPKRATGYQSRDWQTDFTVFFGG